MPGRKWLASLRAMAPRLSSLTLLALSVLEILHCSKTGTAGNEFVRELGLVVRLALVDLLVVVAGIVYDEISEGA